MEDGKGFMNVLITGGAGFIGSNLVNKLVEKGDSLRIIDNLSSGSKNNIHHLDDLHFVEGDIRDVSLLNRLMPGIDLIYHFAASVGNKRSIENPQRDADINVMGTLNLLESARKHGVQKIVLSSSACIFGEPNDRSIKEDHPITPSTPYGCSKLYAEKIALSYAKLYPMEAICLRYFNVYGRNQKFDAYGNVVPIFVFNLLANKPLYIYGDGYQTRDFVNVDDIVQANIKAAQAQSLSGSFNVGSGSNISINQLTKELSTLSNHKPRVIYSAPRPGDVRHSLADISAAQHAFGFVPTVSIRQGLKDYLDWAQFVSSSSLACHYPVI